MVIKKKKIKKSVAKKTGVSLTTKHLPTKPKNQNTTEYYLCMKSCCKGKNITQAAKECKTNAPALLVKRKQGIKELLKATKIIGNFAQDLEKALQH
jgi:hypothetical protein